MRQHYELYLLLIPVLGYYAIFHYGPMYGVQIAFKNFMPKFGINDSPWVGLTHFSNYINSYYFIRLIRNTLLLNFYNLLFGFPAPIILALLINELRRMTFKRVIQTVTYLPHFVSIVVICGILHDFLSERGLINSIITAFGGAATPFLMSPGAFRPVYVLSGIWQEVGWGSIVFLAAISAIDQELYEAATIDGAGKWRQVINVTIPSIAPTIIIMFILRVGHLMNVGAEKILLLYNELTYETADVISTFVYRQGLLRADYSYSTAVGLMNSVINFFLVVSTNAISKRVSETSLW